MLISICFLFYLSELRSNLVKPVNILFKKEKNVVNLRLKIYFKHVKKNVYIRWKICSLPKAGLQKA